jgi:pyruvate-ferredoxin/flavodoxin oxidoreductase
MARQKEAVLTGYWPLYRYHPGGTEDAQPFHLDSRAPKKPVGDFMAAEARYAVLQRTHPDRAARLRDLAQADVEERWRYYEQLAGVVRTAPADDAVSASDHVEEDPA